MVHMAIPVPRHRIARRADTTDNIDGIGTNTDQQAGIGDESNNDVTSEGTDSTVFAKDTETIFLNTDSSDGDADEDSDDTTLNALEAAIEQAVAACQTPTLVCDLGKIRVLNISDNSCSWTCEVDPHYQKPRNNKGPIIGGSVGATAGVLLALLVMLLVTQVKRRRRARAAYLKDTADLASELSDLPLMQHANRTQHSSASSVPSSGNAADAKPSSKLAMSFGIGGSQKWRSSHSDAWATPRMPNPDEAGTELTMDICDRPPESDPTLAATDGALPYRQVKTAAAYPLLEEFSHNTESSSVRAGDAGVNGYSGQIPEPAGSPQSQARHLFRKKQMTRGSNEYSDFATPEIQLLHNYEIAQYSGDAAIAAARDSAVGTPIVAAFNPFNAVPSIRSLPYDGQSLPSVSRKHSDKSNI
ncbi:hypothetical protein LPJ73_005014, partial [Coemansia sp. RSA 2703]